MKNNLFFGVATVALIASAPAYAQSTGSIEVDDEIIVTAQQGEDGVAGIVVPDATKARGILTQELIQTQAAGQSILNTINLIPGVNFTNSDAYGSSGGNIRIRGFDGNRISLTFDGFPLNDSGNYAIFSNQQLDPELIEQVNVNLGTTDVDSPTASAAGGTVNYRTITGTEDIAAKVSASIGDDNYSRVFGWLSSGAFTESGSRIWVSASTARNDKFKGPGRIEKQQYNARFYQPLDNGDFISLAGHYNQNRNNFYRNPSVNDLRTLFTAATIPTAANISSANPLNLSVLTPTQQDALFNFENDATCNQPVKGPGAQNYGGAGFTCTNFYGLRINPSNTGNGRFNSRFTLADQLIFTADASFQYVLANGGGYTTLAENSALARGSRGLAAPGVDFNADGDFSDTVGFYTPNNTNTRRYTAIMSLIYDINDDHRVRIAYTFDRAQHRQTGEWGFLNSAGFPQNVFGGRNGPDVVNADGFALQQRDRLSIALLNQVAGQYIGKLFDEKLRVEIGMRAPFFQRDLTQNCFTQAGGGGFATCTSQILGTTAAPNTTYIVPNNFVVTPTTPGTPVYRPFSAQYKYNKILPNAGLTFKLADDLSTFASYAKGFSAPRTDNLYRQPLVIVTPETTDAFDLGMRYTTSKVQAQATVWYIQYQNRIVTSFDQALGISIDRNVGEVKSYGVDANFAYSPTREITLYTFASYNNSKLQQNIELGQVGGVTIFAPTAGKYVTETPKWTVGGRASVDVGPVSVGAQVKYVSSRFATDVNDVIAPSYTTVDANASFSFANWGLKDTFFQVNAINLFNKFYFGNISTQINHGTIGGIAGSNPNFSVGAPRTIMGTLQIGF